MIERDRYQRLVDRLRLDSTLLRVWPLVGGVSAHVTAVEFAHREGTVQRVIVRRHGAIEKGRNPDIATNEYRLLEMLIGAEIAVPARMHGWGLDPEVEADMRCRSAWLIDRALNDLTHRPVG